MVHTDTVFEIKTYNTHLPTNVISKIQPMDKGIVQNKKAILSKSTFEKVEIPY